jgi:hypothetical protein
MRRAVRTVWLVASRVLIALVVGVLYLVSRNEMLWRAAAHKPLHRVGTSLVTSDPALREMLGENLEQLSRSGYPVAAKVIGFAAVLERGEVQEARERCAMLGWPRCSAGDIRAMRSRLGGP